MMRTKTKLIITDWAKEDRPREKMLQRGIGALTNAELIAILIGSGNKQETAVELSQRILEGSGNSLRILGKSSVDNLIKSFDGIGEAKAISIIAALELGRRRKSEERSVPNKITCSKDAYHLLYSNLIDIPHEEFWIALFNQSNRIIDKIRISQGGISSTTVDIKIILRPAIEKLATSLMLFHNHPSNNKMPSIADDQLTRKIQEAAQLMDIRLLDHLIICEHDYYSYADEGRL